MKMKLLSYCQACNIWNGKNTNCLQCSIPCSEKEVPNKRGGLYYINGIDQPLLSVTEILKVIAKPALIHWAATEAAKSALADPSQSVQEAASAYMTKRDTAGSRGQDVHAILAHDTEIVLADYEEPWKSYLTAFLKFREEMKPEISQKETQVYSKEHQYAGTFDAIAVIGGKKYILDYKTSKGVYDEYSIQLAAYQQAHREMTDEVVDTAVVHLKPDETYSFIEMKGDIRAFLAAKYLYQSLNS